MPVVTEVTDPRQVETVVQYADMLQVGARNMQNFVLLTEVGRASKPVLLKRGMSATVTDLLMSAEYVLSQGNPHLVLCERGSRGFDPRTTDTIDISAVPVVQRISHLPVIIDPAPAQSGEDSLAPLALAGRSVGADGLIIEVHEDPPRAMSDGAQSLYPTQFEELMEQIEVIAQAIGRELTQPLEAATIR